MRASEQEQTAGVGINEVAANFQRIGWGPVVNEQHDLGIDLFVQARDAQGIDRGLIVGVQVKAGKSYFRRPSSENEEAGWWYDERDTRHFDYWVNHGLPNLLVLHNVNTRISYWVHVTVNSVKSTGKGCKILVPENQTIDAEHADDLYSIACQQKAAPSIEGTALSGPRGGVPQGRRLRYALIVPRLLAPHPNAGYRNPVDAVQSVALLAQGRFRALEILVGERLNVPDPGDSVELSWTWRFAVALWKWARTGHLDPLKKVFEEANTSEEKAASGVMLACALRRHERYMDSVKVLSRLLDGNDLAPVDHGWVLVQRARTLADLGDIPQARRDAVEAQQAFKGDHDDITVSALAAAATWLLFTTASQASREPSDLQRDFEELITASDTAVSWWRIAAVAWGLSNAASRQFRAWAEHLSQPPESGIQYLFSAEFIADITGEHNRWRALSALAARQRLMNAETSNDRTQELDEGLQALRRSGDHQSFKRAFTRIKQDGPLEAIASIVRQIPPLAEWTHTTADSHFEALAVGGEFLEENTATELVMHLADLIEDPLDFAERLRPSGVVPFFALNAVQGLLSAANDCAHNRIALLMSELLDRGHIPNLYLAQTLNHIDFRCITPVAKQALRVRAQQDMGEKGASVLGWLSTHDYPTAKTELTGRAVNGDPDALKNLSGLAELNSGDAELLIPWLEELAQETVSDAHRGNSTLGGTDVASCLTWLNFQFPSEARWEEVTELLCDPLVAWHDKRAACWLIAQMPTQLPVNVRDTLTSNIDSVAQASTGVFFANRIGGIGTVLAIAIGALSDAEAERQAIRLTYGSLQERRDVALLLGLNLCPNLQPILASQISDTHPDIRSAAARAVGRLSAANPNRALTTLTRELTARDGTLLPTELLIGLSEGDAPLSTIGIEVAQALQEHPSARIRGFARSQLQ
ncbi:MAG: DUF4365 domain-containing protein [Acidimicrobiia bacterium]|nr:DUF4365 domain-containing protein [Acidimicrobiia bacterium]